MATPNVSAQAPETSDTTQALGEVVFTERAAKAPVTLLPLDVRIVGSAEIDNSAESNLLPVLQNHVPGMFVTERGIAGYGISGGAAGSVSIRGVGGGNKVLFMIDGQPQWAGVFGHSLPDTYLTNDVERVEVVSGPSSMLYGSGAMGGSVNLITRRATKEGFSGKVRAVGGSYATQRYGARAGYRKGGLQLSGAASYESSDGNRRGMDYRLANQYASVSYDVSGHWETGANVMVTETRSDNPGAVGLEFSLDMWAKMIRTTASVYVKNRYDVSAGGIQAYYNYGKHDIDDGTQNGKPRDYLFHSKDFNMGVTMYQTIKPWTGNDLSAGIDFKHWGGKAYNTRKDNGDVSPIVDKHVNEFAGYVMMQQSFLRNVVSLNAGARLEHSSQFGNKWVPQAGFIVHPLRASRIKFSYGRGFRSPNIRELYMYAARNPELRPESMDSYEAELRQWLLDGRPNAGFSIYYIKGDNMIQSVMIDGSPHNVNIGKFMNKGLEIDVTYNIDRNWLLTVNYAYLHTDTRIVALLKINCSVK
ncbi:MAG: TonB-dependent receptor [Muribaculaceae bacterium]|jgi:Outer membrane cobalamin receptor protein|nr:TonB-dependent receptor [Muribaculaceae bacterium]